MKCNKKILAVLLIVAVTPALMGLTPWTGDSALASLGLSEGLIGLVDVTEPSKSTGLTDVTETADTAKTTDTAKPTGSSSANDTANSAVTVDGKTGDAANSDGAANPNDGATNTDGAANSNSGAANTGDSSTKAEGSDSSKATENTAEAKPTGSSSTSDTSNSAVTVDGKTGGAVNSDGAANPNDGATNPNSDAANTGDSSAKAEGSDSSKATENTAEAKPAGSSSTSDTSNSAVTVDGKTGDAANTDGAAKPNSGATNTDGAANTNSEAKPVTSPDGADSSASENTVEAKPEGTPEQPISETTEDTKQSEAVTAEELEKMISALPAPEAVIEQEPDPNETENYQQAAAEYESRLSALSEQVNLIRAGYEALSDEEKAAFEPTLLQSLIQWENALGLSENTIDLLTVEETEQTADPSFYVIIPPSLNLDEKKGEGHLTVSLSYCEGKVLDLYVTSQNGFVLRPVSDDASTTLAGGLEYRLILKMNGKIVAQWEKDESYKPGESHLLYRFDESQTTENQLSESDAESAETKTDNSTVYDILMGVELTFEPEKLVYAGNYTDQLTFTTSMT